MRKAYSCTFNLVVSCNTLHNMYSNTWKCQLTRSGMSIVNYLFPFFLSLCRSLFSSVTSLPDELTKSVPNTSSSSEGHELLLDSVSSELSS